MDLDDLKRTWNDQRITTPTISHETARNVGSYGRKLSNRYLRTAIFALIAVGPMWLCCQYLEMPLWISLWVCIFMVAMGALKGTEWIASTSIDFGQMSLTGALKGVSRLKKMMNRHLIIGIVFGIPLVAVMLLHYYKAFGPGIFIGGLVGAVAGTLIGVRMTVSNRAIIDRMESILDDATRPTAI